VSEPLERAKEVAVGLNCSSARQNHGARPPQPPVRRVTKISPSRLPLSCRAAPSIPIRREPRKSVGKQYFDPRGMTFLRRIAALETRDVVEHDQSRGCKKIANSQKSLSSSGLSFRRTCSKRDAAVRQRPLRISSCGNQNGAETCMRSAEL